MRKQRMHKTLSIRIENGSAYQWSFALETDDAEHVLEQDQKEEHRGDAAEEQVDEIRPAVGIARADGLDGR